MPGTQTRESDCGAGTPGRLRGPRRRKTPTGGGDGGGSVTSQPGSHPASPGPTQFPHLPQTETECVPDFPDGPPTESGGSIYIKG